MAASKPTAGKQSFSQTLLRRAHSPDTASRIHADKITQKPLQLLPTSDPPTSNSSSARAARRATREAKTQRRSHKPKPLSAKERRALGVYDVPRSEVKFEMYKGLHKMWCQYMRGVLGFDNGRDIAYVTAASAGQELASADLHGAEVEVVRCACVGRVGAKGIVVRDTKFTLVVVGKQDKMWVLPKEGTIFRMEVPVKEADDEALEARVGEEQQHVEEVPAKTPLVIELHGSQLMNRAADRANKRFKNHISQDL